MWDDSKVLSTLVVSTAMRGARGKASPITARVIARIEAAMSDDGPTEVFVKEQSNG
jgi:hypothetical protein